MSNLDNMSNLDKAIHQSLSKEDEEFLARLDEEPTVFKQFTGVYKGSFGILNWMVTIGSIILLVVGIFALIGFFNVSPDIEGMLKWGGLTLYCLIVIFATRLWLNMHLQTNRVLRELKKLELQIASLKQNQS